MSIYNIKIRLLVRLKREVGRYPDLIELTRKTWVQISRPGLAPPFPAQILPSPLTPWCNNKTKVEVQAKAMPHIATSVL